jgi:hypothetical protein
MAGCPEREDVGTGAATYASDRSRKLFEESPGDEALEDPTTRTCGRVLGRVVPEVELLDLVPGEVPIGGYRADDGELSV